MSKKKDEENNLNNQEEIKKIQESKKTNAVIPEGTVRVEEVKKSGCCILF